MRDQAPGAHERSRPSLSVGGAGYPGCELCAGEGGLVVWRDDEWRVIRVADDAFPAFYRVVAHRHVAEFSQLSAVWRQRCMDLVCAVEATLLERVRPDKINVASLGNVVPHLHWHVIARFGWDTHFPQPIWGTAQRTLARPAAQCLPCSLSELDSAVAAALSA